MTEDIKKKTNSVFHFVATIAFTRVVNIFIGLVSSIFIARILGVEGRGIFTMFMFIIALGVQFGTFGIPTFNVLSIAKDNNLNSVIYGNSIILSIILGLCVSIIIASINFFNIYNFDLANLLLYTALFCVPFGLCYQFLINGVLGEKIMRKYNLFEFLNKFIPAFFIIFSLLVFGDNINYIIFFILISYVLIAVLLILNLNIKSYLFLDLSIFKGHLFFILKAQIAQLLSYFHQRLPILFVQSNSGMLELGLFSIALMIFDIAIILPTSLATASFSYFSIEKENKSNLFPIVILSCFMFSFLIVTCLYFFSESIINLVFGEEFNKSTIYLFYLLPGLFFASVSSVLMNFLASRMLPLVTIYAPIIGLLSFVLVENSYNQILNEFAPVLAMSVSYIVIFLIVVIYMLMNRTRLRF